ncbi:MAG: type VI secretion system-associated FHA domain protein TagH, partial [Pseudomonadota bacterium]
MGLKLRFQNSGALPGGQSHVEMQGGSLTIGRGEENDLALPDPDRTLSKRHCVLEERAGEYIVTDISTNGTFLNYGAERLGDLPTPLNHGDVILLGPYELVVEISAGAGAAQADPFAAAPPPLEDAPVSPGQAFDARPSGDFVGTLDDPAGKDGGDFLDDLLGAPPAADDRPSWEKAAQREDPLSPADPLPETEDPFFHKPEPVPGLADGTSAPDHTPSTQDVFAAPQANAPLIPEDWDDDLMGAPAADPASPVPTAPKSAPTPPPATEDPFAIPASPPTNAAAAPAAPPQPAPEQAAPPFPKTVLPESEPSAPPPPQAPVPAAPVPEMPSTGSGVAAGSRPTTPPPSGAAGGDAAARAFLDAAGASGLNIPDEELAATMARMGGVFAAMVAGMREILMTRASIKSEMRMNRTMINMGGNNPLKFSISAEQAMEAMIRPSVPGYQDATTATAEALNDIKAHEVAMMSGMEAALKDLLARLDPNQLSERIETGGGLGNLLGGKKARYWEAYEKMYA